MDVYETVESILDSNKGEIQGRTVIQKLVYLSKATIKGLVLPIYKPHYYGPYSPDLSLSLEKMVAYSFIDEIKVPGKMYEGYKYKLTSDGNNMVTYVKENYENDYNKINSLVDTCNEFCKLKTAPLSYAAKVFFMLKDRPKDERVMSFDNAIKRAKELGWEIAEEEVNQGVELLQELKLVKVVQQ